MIIQNINPSGKSPKSSETKVHHWMYSQVNQNEKLNKTYGNRDISDFLNVELSIGFPNGSFNGFQVGKQST